MNIIRTANRSILPNDSHDKCLKKYQLQSFIPLYLNTGGVL